MSEANRPLGITVIAVGYGLAAALGLFKVLTNEESRQSLSISLFQVVLIFVIVWGLWNLRKWGRILALAWSLAAILYGLYGTPHALSLMTRGDTYPMAICLGRTVLHGAVLVYLFQSKIAAAFNPQQSASIGIAPKNPV